MKNKYRIIREYNSYHIERRSFFFWRNVGKMSPNGIGATFITTYFNSVEAAKRHIVKLEEESKNKKWKIVYRGTWKNGQYIIKDKGGF